MTYLKSFFYRCLGLLLCSSTGIAGTNPIGWSVNQGFPNPVYSSGIYTVTYTFTNNLPLQLIKPLQILKDASPAADFSYTDNCSGVRLQRKQSCQVQIHLRPSAIGEKYVQLSIAGYDDNIVPLPEITATAYSTTVGDVTGAVTQALPSSMSANTNENYIFTFTNNSDTDATIITVPVTQTTGTVNSTTTCLSAPLHKQGGTCTVSGGFTPTANTPTTQTVEATLNFTGPRGSPVSVSTSTVIATPIPGGPIVGSVATGHSLPALMTPGQVTNDVELLFTNTSDSTYTFTSSPTVVLTWSDGSTSGPCTSASSPSTQPSCTTIVNNCIINLSPSPAACDVTFNFTAPSGAASSPPKTYTVTGTLTYNNSQSPATASTSGSVITTLPTERTIKMVNNCPFAVSYSLNGASAPCTPGVTVTDSHGACFWQNYVGSSNVLAANTGTDYVTIPANDIGGIQWSGNMSAMVGCTSGTNCTEAICGNNGVGNCAVGIGFNQPATQAEITMLTNAADNYDVETINGFHIPISMTPYYYIDPSNSANNISATADNFSCGTPGNYFTGGGKVNGFGSCNWAGASVPTTPAASYYYFVGGGSGNACGSCLSGEVCGLAQTVPNSTITGPICGDFKGYWTPNQLCTQQTNLPSTVTSGLNCDTALPSDFNLQTDPYGNTYTSLMACHVATGYTGPIYASCYTASYTPPGSSTQCCGCVNWWDTTQTGGVTILANNTSQTCPSGHVDPQWVQHIQGGLQWMKQVCPSYYVYPFDDATSKFTCTNGTQSGANSTGYVITFCAGNSGLPSPTTNDGRTNPPIPG